MPPVCDNAHVVARAIQANNLKAKRSRVQQAALLQAALLVCACSLSPARAADSTYLMMDQSTHKETSESKESAQALCKKILDAYGGEAKMRELELVAFRGKGRVKEISAISHAENSFDMMMVSKGNQLRMEMTIMGQPVITAYDGRAGWTQQGDQVFPADPASVERIQGEINHSLDHQLLDLVDANAHIKILPDKEIAGKLCDVLYLRLPSTSFVMYADKETHLVLRSEFKGIDAENGVSASVSNDYSDYRAIYGTQEPFKIVEYTDGVETTEATQETDELDTSIDDSYFTMPEEPTIARLEQGAVEIPFEYEYNQIIIKARFNDGKELPLIVDSGASQSMLDVNIAKNIGTLQDENYSVTTGGGRMPMKFMLVKTLHIGDLDIDDLAFGVTDGAAFAQLHNSRPAGLLGANVLKRFLVTIDFERRKIILADPHSAKISPRATVVPTKPAMGNLGAIVVGKLDGKLTAPFLIDTGAAFNNVSSDLIKPLIDEHLLPVSKILGLDGQQLNVAAVRFKTLQLGDTVIANPIFSVASAPPGSPGAGIITSKTLGILGNPLWSHFKMTIDYRHNRLILEVSEQQEAFEAADAQLSRVRIQLAKDGQYARAIAACQRMLETPEARKYAAVRALIHAEIGTTIVDEAHARSDRQLMLSAKKDFLTAESLAEECNNPAAQAKIFAKLARHIAEVDRSLVPTANSLVNKALRLAPMDAEVLVAAASVLTESAAPEVTQNVVDQALSADPANWDALWMRYKIAKLRGKQNDVELVEAQLRRYYPDSADVLALGGHAAISGAKARTAKH
jgi:tetratricopeptide (TPR) repeat protein